MKFLLNCCDAIVFHLILQRRYSVYNLDFWFRKEFNICIIVCTLFVTSQNLLNKFPRVKSSF